MTGRRRAPAARLTLLALLTRLPLLAVLAVPTMAAAQLDGGAYPPSSMAVVLKAHAELLATAQADPAQAVVDESPDRYRLLVVYRGERRNLGEDARAVIARLREELPAVPPEYLGLFRSEIAVEAEGKSYWLPVRAQLAPFLDTELANGDPIYVYAVFIGAMGPRAVLLVNEYKKAQVQ